MNAGKYNKKIVIYRVVKTEDSNAFQGDLELAVLSAYAEVKTTRGMTLIRNGSDFEKAYTNFTIRYPLETEITRDMIIKFKGKRYTIEYLNNVDENDTELEIQAKEVTH